MTKTIEGGCHCGTIRFRVQYITAPELLDCNCSICAATGYLHLIIPHSDFTLLSGKDNLTGYRFGSGKAEHLFCQTCGAKAFYQPRSHPDSWSISYNCLNDGHGLTPTIRTFDGRNWNAARASLD